MATDVEKTLKALQAALEAGNSIPPPKKNGTAKKVAVGGGVASSIIAIATAVTMLSSSMSQQTIRDDRQDQKIENCDGRAQRIESSVGEIKDGQVAIVAKIGELSTTVTELKTEIRANRRRREP